MWDGESRSITGSGVSNGIQFDSGGNYSAVEWTVPPQSAHGAISNARFVWRVDVLRHSQPPALKLRVLLSSASVANAQEYVQPTSSGGGG